MSPSGSENISLELFSESETASGNDMPSRCSRMIELFTVCGTAVGVLLALPEPVPDHAVVPPPS